jgi:hypothetical protein
MAMLRLISCILLSCVVACSNDDVPRETDAGVDASLDAGENVDASNSRSARAMLSATDAQAAKRLGVTAPARGDVFIDMAVSLSNTAEDVPLSAPPSAFALETSDLLLFPARTQPVDIVGGCLPAVEIERGGTLRCRLTFEVPKRTVVQRLVYADDTGRTASASIAAVEPPPSLCTLLTDPNCVDCIMRRTLCGSGISAARAAAACADNRDCVNLTGCPTVFCTLSTECQDAIDDLEDCYYGSCFSFCSF